MAICKRRTWASSWCSCWWWRPVTAMATAARHSRDGLCKILKLLEASRVEGRHMTIPQNHSPWFPLGKVTSSQQGGAFEEQEELGVSGSWIGGEKIQGSFEEAERKEEAIELEPWELVQGFFFSSSYNKTCIHIFSLVFPMKFKSFCLRERDDKIKCRGNC